MNEVEVIVTGPEEAYENEAEFQYANQARALAEAGERLASF